MKPSPTMRDLHFTSAVLITSLLSLRCASAPPPLDPQTVRAAILRADEDFARLAQQKGIAEAFATYAAEDATILPAGANPIEGREAIRSYFASATGLSLTWKPFSFIAAATAAIAVPQMPTKWTD